MIELPVVNASASRVIVSAGMVRRSSASAALSAVGAGSVSMAPIGNYIFARKNEVMLCYHVVATGTVELSSELAEYRRYQPHELTPWPRATGLAVADWMRARNLPFEFKDFPGAAEWIAKGP